MIYKAALDLGRLLEISILSVSPSRSRPWHYHIAFLFPVLLVGFMFEKQNAYNISSMNMGRTKTANDIYKRRQ